MREHITPILFDLHWLQIPQRIEFKVLVLTFKCLYGDAPGYLSELVNFYTPSRCLRSIHTDNELISPRYNLESYGARSFKIAAPDLWNSLPDHVKRAGSVYTFKKCLKTHLFSTSY